MDTHPFRLVLAILAVVATLTSIVAASDVLAARCWSPPVAGSIVDRFRPPPCRWCSGNRGLEFAAAPGTAVRSVESGIVTFSGSVAGVVYVVVELSNGWLLTYGRLADARVSEGDAVLAGSIVGRSSTELFFGIRVEGEYRDPAPHLGRWVGRPRLVPVDGSDARPSTDRRLRCPGAAARVAGGSRNTAR